MAYTRRYANKSQFDINTALQNPQFQQIMLKNMGVDYQSQQQPKANFLQRLLALPMAIGSIPDAIYDATEGKNIFGSYLENLGQGVEQAFTGNKVLDTKTTSDLLKKANILQGSDPLSKVANFGLGFAGDVLLDPTTYITFGTGGIAKGGVQAATKGILENIGKEGIEKLGAEGAINLSKILAENGVEQASKYLAEAGIENATKLVTNATKNAVKNTTLKVAGKEVLKNLPQGAKAVELAVNPLKVLGEYGMAGARKYAPEAVQGVEDTFNRLFRGGEYAKSKDLGGLYEQLQNFGRGLQGASRETIAENTQLLDEISKLPIEAQQQFGKMVQGTAQATPELLPLVEKTRNLLAQKEKVLTEKGILGDVVREAGQSYYPQKAVGYTPEFIKNQFGDMSSFILNDPNVVKSLQKTRGAYIPVEEVKKIMEGDTMLSGISKGLGDAENYLRGSQLQRSFPTMEAGEKAGVVYDKNVSKVLGESLVNSEQAILARDFTEKLKTITDDSGNKLFRSVEEFGGKTPPGYKQLNIEGMKGFLAPNEAHDMVKGYMNNFFGDQGTSNIIKAYDTVLKTFKKSVTAMSPGLIGYNIRNALGDVSNMLVGGFGQRNGVLNVSAITDAMGMGKRVTDFEKYMTQFGKEKAIEKFGKEVSDVYANALRSGVLGAEVGQLADEYGRSFAGMEKYVQGKDLLGKVKEIGSKVEDAVTAIPKQREDMFRIANLYDHFKQTGSWEEAGKLARLSSLDYGNLTPFEKNVMKRIIPFYSFMRQNLELQLKTFATNPGRIVTQQKFLRDLGQSLSDQNMSQEDWDALPDWMKTGLSVALGKNGNKVDIFTGFGDPTSALNDIIGTDAKDTLSNFVNSMSPALKIPIEQVTGQSLYTGRDISENTDATRYKNAPDFLKELIGYKEIKGVNSKGEEFINYRADPQKLYWLENTPFVAPYTTMYKRLGDLPAFNQEGDWKYLANLLSGARIYQKDLARERSRKERDQVDLLNKLLIDYGVAKPRSGVYLSPSFAENSPEIDTLLKSLGYSHKTKTQSQKEKYGKQQEAKKLYLNELLNTLQ